MNITVASERIDIQVSESFSQQLSCHLEIEVEVEGQDKLGDKHISRLLQLACDSLHSVDRQLSSTSYIRYNVVTITSFVHPGDTPRKDAPNRFCGVVVRFLMERSVTFNL